MDKRELARRVWAALSTDTDLELAFGWQPEVDRAEVRQVAHDLWMQYNDKKLHLQETYNRISAAAETDEDFEQLAAAHPEHDVLLAMRLDAETDWQTWKLVKPE